MPIPDNLNQIKKELPETVKLVAVSKTKPVKSYFRSIQCRSSFVWRKQGPGIE